MSAEIDNADGNEPIGVLSSQKVCEDSCTGSPDCKFYLWKDEPGANSRYACATFKNCDEENTFLDGSPTIYEKTLTDAKVHEDTMLILNAYGSFKDESCGQAEKNQVEVGGAVKLAGSVDECKMKCSTATGSQECHGFTFDSQLGQCTFHYDVVSGEVKKAEKFTCFFKNLA